MKACFEGSNIVQKSFKCK